MFTVSRRGSTRGEVLDVIRAEGRVSRVEIAESLTLAQASVTSAVKDLMAAGLVRETGHKPSNGGRPRIVLELNPAGGAAVGVHLGWNSTTVVLTDLTGTVIDAVESEGAGDNSPADIVAGLAADVATVRAASASPVIGLGLAVPGPIDPPHGTAVQLPSRAPWSDFSFSGALSEATGLPVIMDNDANAAAVGEYWTGDIGRDSNIAVVCMNIGFGAGILVEGVPFRGTSWNAGEIGHVSIDMNGEQCHCGNRGCVELIAAPAATEARYQALTGTARDYPDIAAAADAGEQAAIDAITVSADALAAALVSVVNVIDTDQIVLSGRSFEHATDVYVQIIQQRLDSAQLVRRTHRVTVRSAYPGHLTGAIGAATLVLHDLVVP